MHGCYQFRVTRNSDLFVDEDEAEDLLRAVQGELSRTIGQLDEIESARVMEANVNMIHFQDDSLARLLGSLPRK
jgi:polyphosphate kinase